MNGRGQQKIYRENEAKAYGERSAKRNKVEWSLLERALSLCIAPNENSPYLLDAPCGRGRFSEPLEKLGFKVTGLDLSLPMLKGAGKGLLSRVEQLPFKNHSFEIVLSHRFLHHLPPEALEKNLTELARVAGKYLVLSFFHPFSLHGLKRLIASKIKRKRSARFATHPGTLEKILKGEGFLRVKYFPQFPFFREHWLVLFKRSLDGGSEKV